MSIAVLGWGSLIWDRGCLNISEENWHTDGPSLPLEYARISNGNRLTLVIKPEFDLVQTLYATTACQNLEKARKNLQERERTPNINNIGFYDFNSGERSINRNEDQISTELENWNQSHNFDAVIWTDLGPKFSNHIKVPFNLVQIFTFFDSLSDEEFVSAQEYVFNTPPQIQTRFRSDIENYFSKAKKEASSNDPKVSAVN